MKNDTVNNVVSCDRCLKKYGRLYKKYPGYAHGVVPAFRADFSSEQNRELQLKTQPVPSGRLISILRSSMR